MSNFKLNLPTDIPWVRKCVSQDMLDDKLCDKKSPLRWRSSIAVFEYKPEEEYQNYEGLTVSYLKVTCTVAGYQEDPNEIGLSYKGLRSYWRDQPGIEDYLEVLQKYYACHGAVLEVTVGPENSDTRLADFPYFMDFEPKKRELYETATDTKESMSRSIEALNLTKSAGTTQSVEVFDIDMGGGGFGSQGSFAGTGGGFNYSAPNGQWGTKRMNADESMVARSEDVGQEKRETFSFSSQISQLYHQLDSYHLGHNRALFFLLPRPHTVDTEHTFVNGPRCIEGIQEFMFVVARPKEVENICVEVYLETAHIGKVPITERETRQATISLTVYENFDGKSGDELDRNNSDNTEDRSKEDQSLFTAPNGFEIVSVGPVTRNVDRRVDDCKITEQDASHAILWGKVTAHFQDDFGDNQVYDARLEATATVYLQSKTPVVTGSKDTLFITGRKLCCCPREFRVREGIVYEKPLKHSLFQIDRNRSLLSAGKMPIVAANRLRDEIRDGMINSRTDFENRYETFVHLPQTNFASKTLHNIVKETYDVPVRDARNIPENLRDKFSGLNPEVKLKDVLAMPFEMLKDVLSLNDEEAIDLRNAITGVSHTNFDPREAWLSKRQMGRMFGGDSKAE
ncbi:hypothetical protein [Pontibacter chitinilyticus]|uniref:hypothetical protein n=1 Tax=Pontibacter chitinilyticus TaxID=2674989 RepID=UPI00321A4BCE